MKKFKTIALYAACSAVLTFVVGASFIGCSTTSPQTAAYNTIYTVETTASAAVDGYYAAVIKGQSSTNEVPQVSRAFNDLQAACTLAAVTSENGTNGLASTNLTAELSDLLNLVNTVSQTK